MQVPVSELKSRIAKELEAFKAEHGRPLGHLDEFSADLQTDIKDTVMPEVLSQGWSAAVSFLNAFGGQQLPED